MATCFIRLTVFDPEVIEALESLKRSRKQSAFVVEALRQYLSTEEGKQLLRNMMGTAKPAPASPSRSESCSRPSSSRPSTTNTDLDDIFRR